MPIEYIVAREQIPFYIFVVVALMALGAFTWQFRQAPGAKPQMWGQVAKSVALSSLVMASVDTGVADKLFWLKLFHLAIVFVPYLGFELVIQISGQDRSIPAWTRNMVRGVVGCLWLAILAETWHGFLWREVWLDGEAVRAIAGPVLAATRVTNYLLSMAALALGVRWALITKGLRRQQAMWITFSGLVSIVGGVFFVVPGAQWLAPLPLGFLLGGGIVTWSFYRWQVYNVLPLAAEATVRNMNDGLLVIDEYDYIVDMNPAAEAVLGGLPDTVGGRFDKLAEAWPALAETAKRAGREPVEGMRSTTEGNRYYQLTAIALQTGGHWLGEAIVFKDITRQKQDQAKVLETEKALSILSERKRLGREIHDGHGQIWAYLTMELQTLRSLATAGLTPEAGHKLDKLIDIVKEMQSETRASLVGLNKAAGAGSEFVANLRDYLVWYEKTSGIATELTLPQELVESLFGHISQVQLLRIIQEALTNVRKHAKARQVKVAIEKVDCQVTVLVEDDGCGFDLAAANAANKGFGLQIMTERAEEAGGRLTLDSKPGVGTRVEVDFCLETAQNGGGMNENAACG